MAKRGELVSNQPSKNERKGKGVDRLEARVAADIKKKYSETQHKLPTPALTPSKSTSSIR